MNRSLKRAAATPNGQKISIFLEELGIPYTVTPVDLAASEQKKPQFMLINPNGRIPAIVDHSRNDFFVFESGAILLYLAEHYDKDHRFSFEDADERSEMLQWLFLQNASMGPMQAQANHFVRYAYEQIPYGMERYQNETKRLYRVLESRLGDDGGREYLAGKNGGQYSIADITTFAWVRWAPWAGLELEGRFPQLNRWMRKIEARGAVQRGLLVPGGDDQIAKMRQDPNVEDPLGEWSRRASKASARPYVRMHAS
ncbi:glutathione S-transferase [Corynespora cassiicola Philippines]|uniref:Glutathione S-transferase n=1 Tax=Corynespora cassiicola Philippines TaxID=1448308 RepID=A0A2T2NCR4_CORCC|nr:glutathione S-transferase [Corynespora cassiicola Philippines]